jgi:hypothetical protein
MRDILETPPPLQRPPITPVLPSSFFQRKEGERERDGRNGIIRRRRSGRGFSKRLRIFPTNGNGTF